MQPHNRPAAGNRRRPLAALGLALLLALPTLPVRAADDMSELERMGTFVQLMSRYYELMGNIHAVAADPDKSAVLQMTKLKEFLERSGQRERVPTVLRQVADGTGSPAVRNAATMMLAEALAERGEHRAAAEVLERALLARSAR